MEFISDNNVLITRFKTLCTKYSHYKWAVAWAGNIEGFDLAKMLIQNERKIDLIVVGLHFYQTSPEFIKQFLGNRNIKYYTQTDGTFHTKIYLFYNSCKDWSAIVGSSNFTQYGFHKNKEANILLTCNDNGISFSEIDKYITSLWQDGKYYNKQELDSYIDAYKFQSKKIVSLNKYGNEDDTYGTSYLEIMTWSDYMRSIQQMTDTESLECRYILLDEVQKLLNNNPFNSLDWNVRSAIAGIISNIDTIPNVKDWKSFGSNGNGKFRHELKTGVKIGKALDKIPISGKISEKQFKTFCEVFNQWNDPLASVSRLLAMKRPDFFVCINGKNKKELSRLLNIPKTRFTIDNYWNILMRIHKSVWFEESIPENATKREKKIKKYQVAMLDCISYVY